MSATELRGAAETLRERANATTPGEWIAFGQSIGVTVKGCTCAGTAPGYPQHESYCGTDGPIVDGTEPDIAYIATMHPGVGLVLADWLDELAESVEVDGPHDWGNTTDPRWAETGTTVARLINGGPS